MRASKDFSVSTLGPPSPPEGAERSEVLIYNYIIGGCGKRGGDRRLRFLLTDELSVDPIRFYVTCFGRYAEELEDAGIDKNEVVEIWKPYIALKRWQPGEKRGDNICDYELVS